MVSAKRFMSKLEKLHKVSFLCLLVYFNVDKDIKHIAHGAAHQAMLYLYD